MRNGFDTGFCPWRMDPIEIHKLTATLTTKPVRAPYEFANGTNMPSEITPSRGPPSIPKMLRDIWRTVLPACSHRNDSAIVEMPNIAALKNQCMCF